MIKFIEDNLIGLLISIIILGYAITGCLIIDSNKYKNDIAELKKENKELMARLNNAYDCDCGWYEDFYYEHSEEVGAYE